METAKWKGSGNPPYGYLYDKHQKLLIVHKSQAVQLKNIFNYALENPSISTREIAFLLNKNNVPSSRGNKWTHKTVSYLFQPHYIWLYAGYINEVKGSWEPIIDKTTAAKLLRNPIIKTTRPRPRIKVNLLPGLRLAYCGHCEATMKSATSIDPKNKVKRGYYHCTGKVLYGSHSCPASRMYPMEVVDEIIENDLMLCNKNLKTIEQHTRIFEAQRNKKLEIELRKISQQIEITFKEQAVAQDTAHANILGRKLSNLIETKNQLTSQKLFAFDFREFKKDQIWKFNKLTIEKRKQLLKKYITRINIFTDKLVVEYKFYVERDTNKHTFVLE